MNRFDGKVAVITGASRGIGLGIAMRLVAEGARVCVTAASTLHPAKTTWTAVPIDGNAAPPAGDRGGGGTGCHWPRHPLGYRAEHPES